MGDIFTAVYLLLSILDFCIALRNSYLLFLCILLMSTSLRFLKIFQACLLTISGRLSCTSPRLVIDDMAQTGSTPFRTPRTNDEKVVHDSCLSALQEAFNICWDEWKNDSIYHYISSMIGAEEEEREKTLTS